MFFMLRYFLYSKFFLIQYFACPKYCKTKGHQQFLWIPNAQKADSRTYVLQILQRLGSKETIYKNISDEHIPPAKPAVACQARKHG